MDRSIRLLRLFAEVPAGTLKLGGAVLLALGLIGAWLDGPWASVQSREALLSSVSASWLGLPALSPEFPLFPWGFGFGGS